MQEDQARQLIKPDIQRADSLPKNFPNNPIANLDLHTKIIFFIFFPLLSFAFLLHYWIVGQAVYGDGIYYYAYTRSLYKDHDLNFSNEFSHSYNYIVLQ